MWRWQGIPGNNSTGFCSHQPLPSICMKRQNAYTTWESRDFLPIPLPCEGYSRTSASPCHMVPSVWNSCPLVSCFLQASTQILSLDEDGPDLFFMSDTNLQQNKFLMYSTHLWYARPWATCWGSTRKTQFLPSRISSPFGETQLQCYAMVQRSSVGAWRRCTHLTGVFNPGCNQGRLPGGSDIRAESLKETRNEKKVLENGATKDFLKVTH